MPVVVPDAIREYLIAHPSQAPKDAAAHLGVPVGSVYTYRSALIRAGLIPANSRMARRAPNGSIERAMDYLRKHPRARAAEVIAATGVQKYTVWRARCRLRSEGVCFTLSDRLRADPGIYTDQPIELARRSGASLPLVSAVQSEMLRLRGIRDANR